MNREMFLGREQVSNPSCGFPWGFREKEPQDLLSLGFSRHEILWRNNPPRSESVAPEENRSKAAGTGGLSSPKITQT